MANIQFGGLITGLDTNALITGIGKAEHAAADVLQRQKTVLQAQSGVYVTVAGALGGLKSAAENLSLSNDFNKRTTSTSDTTVVTASADSTADLGTSKIVVDTLAKAQSLRSTSFATSNASIGPGTLTIAVGSSTTTVTIDGTNNTLSGLKAAINSSGAAVTASIVNVGVSGSDDYRLVVQNKDTGVANAASISGTLTDGANPFAGGGTVVQAAADAIFSVNGLRVVRSGNTISDVLPGVTFVLAKEGNHDGTLDAADASANITVSSDSASISAGLQRLVDNYNAVNKIINAQFSLNPDTKRTGVLGGDGALRGVIGRIRTELSARGGSTGNIHYLSDVGVTFQKDGSLTFDSDKLAEALGSDSNGVKALFSLVEGGIGKRVPTAIDSFIGSLNGTLTARQQGIQKSIDRINQKIANEEARITLLQDRLTQQFSSLEKSVSQLKSQGEYLAQQLGALSAQTNFKSSSR